LAVLDALLAQATPTTTAPGPVVELRGPGAATLVVGVGVVLAVIWWLPIWLDARRAYRLRERAITLIGGRLLDAAKKDGLKVSELRELLATIGEPATGQRGLARALMAFTIITIVGVALAALLLSSAGDASDLRKTVVTSLLTLLGTIVGFYFGTRAAEGGSERAPEEPTPAVPAEQPTAPETGEPTDTVTEEPTVPTAEEAAAPAGEEAAPATAEEPAPPVAEDDPEEQLDAGLTEAESSPEELDSQAAAEHGELSETEVDYEAPDEEDLQPDDTDDDEAEEQP
jgi:hypothetical protein